MKEYKEVKRQVQVGDKIKVVNAWMSSNNYVNGDILTVVDIDADKCPIIKIPKSTKYPQGRMYLALREFVVLEEVKREFKVGDRVRIRSWEDMEKEFDIYDSNGIKIEGAYFAYYMKHLCGREATIYNKRNDKIELENWSDDSGDLSWHYTKDMLELVEEKKEIKIEENPTITITQDGNKVIATNTSTGK